MKMDENVVKFVIDFERMCKHRKCVGCPLSNGLCGQGDVTYEEAEEFVKTVQEWNSQNKTNGERVMEALNKLNVFSDSDNKVNNTYNPSITFGYEWWNEISNDEK